MAGVAEVGVVVEVPGAEEAATRAAEEGEPAKQAARSVAAGAEALRAEEVEVAGGRPVARADVAVVSLALTEVACEVSQAARLLLRRVKTRSGLTGSLSGIAVVG